MPPLPEEERNLTLQTPWGYFNHRVGCLIFRDEHVLLQQSPDGYWFLPGGRVKFSEDSAATVAREIEEEFGTKPLDWSLAAVIENFFSLDGHPFHEIGFYYRISIPGNIRTDIDGMVAKWHFVADLPKTDLRPAFFRTHMGELKEGVRHFVNRSI